MEASIPFDKNDSTELFKSKRAEYAVEIRKKKNEEIINYKRFKLTSAKQDEKIFDSFGSVSARTLTEQFLKSVATKDINAVRGATEAVRISLCTTPDKAEPYVLEYLESGVAKILIMFLEETYKCYPELQCDASWALCNIVASSTQSVAYVVRNGIIEKTLAGIQFGKDKFLENCLWILANIAGDSKELRDELMKHDLIKKVTHILCQGHDNEKIKSCVWLLSNLARGKPFPPLEKFSGCLSILAQLIHSSDEGIVEHVLWCFNYISEEGDNERVAAVCNVGVIPKTVKLLLKTKNERIAELAFKLCGNIALGSCEKIEILLEHGFLNILSNNIESRTKRRRKETCWVICNIAAEKVLLEKLFQSDILTKTISVMQKDDLEVRIEATHIIKNVLDNCDNEQLEQLMKRDLIGILLRNSEMHNPVALIDVSLDVLRKILHHGNTLLEAGSHKLNVYTKQIFEINGNVVLEKLQKHPNPTIYDKIVKLFDDYFTFDVV